MRQGTSIREAVSRGTPGQKGRGEGKNGGYSFEIDSAGSFMNFSGMYKNSTLQMAKRFFLYRNCIKMGQSERILARITGGMFHVKRGGGRGEGAE